MSFGASLLHELTDLLATLTAEHADGHERVAVIVPLKKERLARAKELVAQDPPFDPAELDLTQHQVFLTEDEAIFVFAGPHVRTTLERVSRDPTLWAVGLAWRRCISGRPRLTTEPTLPPATAGQPVYDWAANSDLITSQAS